MVPSTYKIPMNSFGPYTPNTATKGCAAANAAKWAFGTCTLLKGLGPSKVAAAAEGTRGREGGLAGWGGGGGGGLPHLTGCCGLRLGGGRPVTSISM